MDRRQWLEKAAILSLLPLVPRAYFQNRQMISKSIPKTGEKIPVIGLGTWQTFDVSDNPGETEPLTEVLKTLIDAGGKVVDSSPMYGRAEKVVGELSSKAGVNSKLFIATKVWTTGRENGIKQMIRSRELLQRQHIDLMQIHNLSDWRTHLPVLRDWKETGRIRYTGITHYSESAYVQIEQILRNESIDFLQINYSLLSRKAEERLFPLAMDKQVAVIINRPFEEGALFRLTKGKPLPDFAGEFDCKSWGQFFLKFIISHPAVSCAIPGTSKPHHMLDNAAAGAGALPDESQRKKMIRVLS